MAVAAAIGITVCFAFLRRAVRRAAIRSAGWESIQKKRRSSYAKLHERSYKKEIG